MPTTHPGISWTVLISGAGLAAVIAGAGWTLFQDKNMQAKEADAELRAQLRTINAELLARRHEFVSQEEFKQFQGRVLDRLQADERRLDVLEAGRAPR